MQNPLGKQSTPHRTMATKTRQLPHDANDVEGISFGMVGAAACAVARLSFTRQGELCPKIATVDILSKSPSVIPTPAATTTRTRRKTGKIKEKKRKVWVGRDTGIKIALALLLSKRLLVCGLPGTQHTVLYCKITNYYCPICVTDFLTHSGRAFSCPLCVAEHSPAQFV